MLPSEILPRPLAAAILVVGDVADDPVALSALLEADGIRAVTARSGAEALAALGEHDVALTLIAADAPGMDGLEVAAAIRGTERTRTVPIIFVTGEPGEPALTFKGDETGPVDYLVKPIEPRLLRSKVDTFVELHRQRRQLSSQLLQLKEMLRFSDMFVALLGHDLRGPLQSVELGAQVILGKPDDAATIERMAHTMQRASRRMARLIEQLLDFARARLQGAIPILPRACDLDELVRGVVSELDPAAAARVTVELAGDRHVQWDHDRIVQVLSNVLGNAVQHGASDAPIAIAVTGDADRVTVDIRNRGHIPPELLPMLFDPFSRAESGHRSGIGLGLYIVDRLVRAHGGSIHVESTPESGTCFRIALPRAAAA